MPNVLHVNETRLLERMSIHHSRARNACDIKQYLLFVNPTFVELESNPSAT